MTISELIAHLNTYENKDMRVMVDGYESGFCDVFVDRMKIRNVGLNSNHDDPEDDGIYGQHDLMRYHKKNIESIDTLIISRNEY